MKRSLLTSHSTLSAIILSAALLAAVGGEIPLALSAAQTPVYDLVITNARVVDGTGNPWFRADVGITGGRVARVGRIGPSEARRVVDAQNRILAPGFIDVHTHVEDVYNLPAAENFVRMGVTTLVTGNCGGSVIDVGKFLARTGETPLGPNIATLVGHGSVRLEVMGSANRAPTSEELERMKALVAQAMNDGAVGLSTGLEYVPATYAKTEEIVELARIVSRHGGIYATHMRNEGEEVVEAVKESIAIGETAGLPVEISHFKISNRRLWGKSTTTLGLVREARARGLAVTVDQYAYAASSTSLDIRLPTWLLEGGRAEGRKRLADPAIRKKVIQEMKETLKRRGFKDYSHAMVASYRTKPEFNGKSIAEITKTVRGSKDVEDQIEQIIEMYEAGGAQMIYHTMSEDDVQRIMREPFTMIASDSGVRRFGEGVPHPRGYGNNARVLGRYVRDLNVTTLQDAIRKMTSLPAQTFGLQDRGLIREGMAADLVIFDEKTVGDPATFEQPHRYAEGFSYVFVNGVAIVDNGHLTDARPGAALRRGARAAVSISNASGI